AKLFQPMAISIILEVISAILVALFVVPALATFMFNKGVYESESFVLIALDKVFRNGLYAAMYHTKVVIIGSLLLLVGG
uniref:hypothetical protein n=1 Tax=Pseudoalteromonas sp. Q18-MNA-CIBAN-0097 TaxID=3140440 RepID=UPI003332AF96